jgi:hypothetical protein
MGKRYHEPPIDAQAAAWNRGFMTPLEVLRCAAWKSALGLGELTLNTEEAFRDITAEAMAAISSWRGTSAVGNNDDSFWTGWHATAAAAIGSNQLPKAGLMRLNGVGYPMATALLCILDPEVWPVMDRWAVQTVFGLHADGSQYNAGLWQRSIAYTAYARHLAVTGPDFWPEAATIHALDQAAMKASMPESRAQPAGRLPSGWQRAKLPVLK